MLQTPNLLLDHLTQAAPVHGLGQTAGGVGWDGFPVAPDVSRWPVSCADCNEISSANVLASPLTCSKCGSRNVVELQDTHAGDGGGTMLLSGEDGRVLKDGRYKCPRCGKFELRTERGLDPAWVD
jgi:DNA-directed RNA polymerase subunit RPC12/RpoP